MQSPPDDVKLRREDGNALIERLQANTLTGDDRRLLVKLIQLYFWLTVALRETKISLKRLKRALFGEGKPPPPPPPVGGGAVAGGSPATPAAGEAVAKPPDETPAPSAPVRRRGHGRQGAEAYSGAEQVLCRQEELAAGQPCPAGGRGTL